MIVYKYTSAAHWENLLKETLIRFSPPSVFNDPFEMQPFYESLAIDPEVRRRLTEENAGAVLKEELQRALPVVPAEIRALFTAEKAEFLNEWADLIAPFSVAVAPMVLEEITDSIGEGIYSGLNRNVGVLSLCEKPDDLLMWAHYGDQHKGLVIGFDGENKFFDQRFNAADDFRHLRPVQYTQTRPTIQFAREDEMSKILLTKSEEWSYEKEWRMLLPLVNAEKELDVMGEKISLFKFPPESIVEIIIGCRTSDRLIEDMQKYVMTEERYSHVKLFIAELDRREFRLRFIEV